MLKNKTIIFDIMILVFGLLFLGLVALVWFWPTKTLPGQAVLGVKVFEKADLIKGSVQRGDTVYLNGSKNKSTVLGAADYEEGILITISGPAESLGPIYNFNGQRVLIGQKAELHGRFFAQGVITSFNYEK